LADWSLVSETGRKRLVGGDVEDWSATSGLVGETGQSHRWVADLVSNVCRGELVGDWSTGVSRGLVSSDVRD
jgi:hypothetical protein